MQDQCDELEAELTREKRPPKTPDRDIQSTSPLSEELGASSSDKPPRRLQIRLDLKIDQSQANQPRLKNLKKYRRYEIALAVVGTVGALAALMAILSGPNWLDVGIGSVFENGSHGGLSLLSLISSVVALSALTIECLLWAKRPDIKTIEPPQKVIAQKEVVLQIPKSRPALTRVCPQLG